MAIEFDPRKAKTNLATHGIAFSDAARFDWDTAHIVIDDREYDGEVRYLAFGFIDANLRAMVFTERRDVIRVISLRRTTRKERTNYAKLKK